MDRVKKNLKYFFYTYNRLGTTPTKFVNPEVFQCTSTYKI